MKKVVLLVPRLIGHGQERMAALAADLLISAYDVTLVVFYREKNEYPTKANVISLDSQSKDGWRKIPTLFERVFKFIRYRKNNKPDVVISFGTSANFVNSLSKSFGKTVISYRGFASIKKEFSLLLCCFLADKIYCISSGMREELYKISHSARRKTEVIYNGIDIDRIHTLSLVPCDDFNPSFPSFVSVGRLEDVKGYRHLINSFAIVSKTISNASLYFIGTGSRELELKSQIQVMGLSNKVFFLGAQTNPFSYMRKCTALVQTSITEGFMNVLVEGGVCGLPAISTDCKYGPREILSENHICETNNIDFSDYGILVPPFESNYSIEKEKESILADAMIRLVSSDQYLSSYSIALKKRVARFSSETYKQNLINIIEK